tara:strand:+ start:179 stop:1273 length:1095 start_codon:yes stop_codon:yes gene_type:complete
MKIAFDHTIFLIQKYGGVSRYFCEVFNNLKKKHQTKILSPFYQNNFLKDYNLDVLKLKKINYIPKYSTKLLNYSNLLINTSYLKIWKPDVIHKTYYNDYKYSFIKAKKILNVWDLSHEIYHDMYNKPKNWRPKRSALETADHVICSSRKTQKDLINFYEFDIKKTSVVYQSAPNLTTNNTLLRAKKKNLLFVGSRKKYKNFDKLLEAFSLNPQILNDFKLICFGEEKLSKEENYLLEKFNLDNSNIIFESGNDKKLSELYSNSTALIYPSKNEGFGFPPLEAMSYGCPVISSNNEAILEATSLNEFSFNPDDPKDILNKIEKVIYSDETIEKLMNYGLIQVKKFSVENTFNALNDIYHKINSGI